jgi:hypothetical protein
VDGIKRGPVGDDQEFRPLRHGPAQDGRAQESGRGVERGKGFGPKVCGIGLRALRLGEAAPVTGEIPQAANILPMALLAEAGGLGL